MVRVLKLVVMLYCPTLPCQLGPEAVISDNQYEWYDDALGHFTDAVNVRLVDLLRQITTGGRN